MFLNDNSYLKPQITEPHKTAFLIYKCTKFVFKYACLPHLFE